MRQYAFSISLRIQFSLLLLFTCLTAGSQIYNLVPNGSFENTSCCPTTGSEFWSGGSCIPGWFNPNYATPDYFNPCAISSFVSTPSNGLGYQQAQEGTAYAGFFFFIGGNTREYIEGILSEPLIAGKKYCVSFYANFPHTFQKATDAIGAYLSVDSLLNDTNSQYFNLIPQIINPIGNVITDTANWVQIQDTLIAQGGERFITIGNFNSDQNSNFDTVSWGIDYRCYYFIDNVSVTLCENNYTSQEIFFPSLLSGQEHFFINNLPPNTRLEIFDSRGRTIYFNDNYDNRFSATQAEAGVYFYRFIFPGGETRRGKLLIWK